MRIKRFFLFSLLLLLGMPSLAYTRSIHLQKSEKTVFSQNGEDGVIEKIFNLVGTSSKYYVEFGGYDGYLCSNTRFLREIHGWTGLLLDGGFEDFAINLRKEFITAENINTLFKKYNVPQNLDFLSIDIDYNDFYVWQALSDEYKPKLIVIEYNATHLPNVDRVVEYSPFFSGDGTNYFGASILAFYKLGRKKGYSLVYADKNGVNLFFLRDDLIHEKGLSFKYVNNVENLYMKPQYGVGPNGGHTADPQNRPYLQSTSILVDD